ncbi:MAG: LVIVD repeat-containing protein [Acidimicrobiales bacterium]
MARLRKAFLAVVLMMSVMAAAPAGADDPDGDHVGPGSTGPDLHSKKMKLLANLPPSNTARQSDLAFRGKLVFAGTYNGFRVVDVSDPENPVQIGAISCNGPQGDVSVYGNLVFQSVDTPQTNPGCESVNTNYTATPGAWEGIRIFDVTNPAAPAYLASVATDCGSHTHTLVPDPGNGRVLLYVSSYPLGTAALGPNCSSPHGFISIVSVLLANPAAATVSKYFFDPATETAVYPLTGGPFVFQACHDISVFVEIKRAAAACLSESQVWDISDPANPVFLWRFDHPVVNPANIDLWHSASFSWDGEVVAFGDESGGGAAARCVDPSDLQGRIWFLNAQTGAFLANYKIPRSEPGTCTMHNFNFVPLRDGRKVLVSSAYTAGTTAVDVNALIAGATPAAAELGFYKPAGANTWSSYWYNGRIYANDNRGLDIMDLVGPSVAGNRKLPYLNPQTQESLIP